MSTYQYDVVTGRSSTVQRLAAVSVKLILSRHRLTICHNHCLACHHRHRHHRHRHGCDHVHHKSSSIFSSCQLLTFDTILKLLKEILIFYTAASQKHIHPWHRHSETGRQIYFHFISNNTRGEWSWGGENNPFYFKPSIVVVT